MSIFVLRKMLKFKTLTFKATVFLFCSVAFTANVMAYAESDRKGDECRLISSQEAIKKAQKQTGGKVVSIKLNKNGSRSVYKVRVLVEDKRIKNLSIKACK